MAGAEGNQSLMPAAPDPTALTAAAVSIAKEDLRREMASVQVLIETRMNGIEEIVLLLRSSLDHLPAERQQQAELLQRELDRRISVLANEDERIRAEITRETSNLERLHEERFTAISQQFTERDVRSDQDKKSSKEALDAALLAQKESVSQQNDANTTAATKSETSFTKQIDQIGTLIATLEKSLTDRITELKERIDRGEGGAAGSRASSGDWRAWLLGVGALVVVVAIAVIGKL